MASRSAALRKRRALSHDLGHAAAESITVRQNPGLKRVSQVRNAPTFCEENVTQNWRCFAAPWKAVVPGKAGAVIKAPCQGSARVTGSAMCSPLDQLPSAVPRGRRAHKCVRLGRIKVGRAPELQSRSETEGKADVVGWGCIANSRDGAERLPEVGNVLIGKTGVERVGENRVVGVAVGRHPLAHRLGEILHSPAPDPGLPMRCDVRWHEGAEGCVKRRTSRERQSFGGRVGMAGHAATCAREIGPTFGIAGREARGLDLPDRPQCQHPGTYTCHDGWEDKGKPDQTSHGQFRPARNCA